MIGDQAAILPPKGVDAAQDQIPLNGGNEGILQAVEGGGTGNQCPGAIGLQFEQHGGGIFAVPFFHAASNYGLAIQNKGNGGILNVYIFNTRKAKHLTAGLIGGGSDEFFQ